LIPMRSFQAYVEDCLEKRDVAGIDSSKYELLFFRRRQGDIRTGLVMVTRCKPTGPPSAQVALSLSCCGVPLRAPRGQGQARCCICTCAEHS